METNDLNKSSEEKMDLNSENKPETTKQKLSNLESENAPAEQNPEPEPPEGKDSEPVINQEQTSESTNGVMEETNQDEIDKDTATSSPVAKEDSSVEEKKEADIPSKDQAETESEVEEPADELQPEDQTEAESEVEEPKDELQPEDQPENPVGDEVDDTTEEASGLKQEPGSSTTGTPKEVTDQPEEKVSSSAQNEDSGTDAEKPAAPETSEVKSETPQTTSSENIESPQEVNYSAFSREELVARFQELINSKPLPLIKGHLEVIRSTFEGKTAREHAALKKKFMETGEAEENFAQPNDPLLATFSELLYDYRKKRDDERNRKEEEKKKNLIAKYEVIESIKDLVNRQESLNVTFQEFRDLQQKWRDIGPVPQKEMHDMWETYHLHVENFYNYTKINKELRDLDLKKNYETKVNLCEQAEKLLLEPTIVKAFKTLQKFHDQWRETGPVPRENKDELWARFKEITGKINQKHQEHFENIKKQFEKNLEDKRELCKQAEAFLENKFHNAREWEKASKAIIELQQVWKTIGFAPKKENTEVYHRFRKACDTFFSQKRDFFKQYKDSQAKNLELKTELCLEAEAMKDSKDWKTTTNEFIRIQKRWKEIGPVPRRSSDAIWKRFREACDHFFNEKSAFFNKKDETQEENLKMKEDLIEELKQYQPTANNDENFNNLQSFQSRWSQIGFVPFKDKDRLTKEFHELINAQFDKLNMDETNKSLQKYRSKLESWKGDRQFSDRIIQERNKTIGKLKVIENDISIWENNIGFFAKSKNSDALIRDFRNKIESGKRLIKTLNQRLDLLDEMFERS